MKRWILSSLLMTSVLSLTACGEQSVREVESRENTRFTGLGDSVKIITDSETGCKYLYVKDGVGDHATAGLSPLLNSSGEADCSSSNNDW